MATVQIRIDEKTKRSSQKVLDNLGLDLSSAIKIYLRQIVTRQGIPFRVVTENGMTLEQEDEILRRSEEAQQGKNVTKAMSAKAALKYLQV